MERNRFLFLILWIIILSTSCSGYRVSNVKNPFAVYNIQSISVPMFYNNSLIPHAEVFAAQEIVNLLKSFEKLEVHVGENKKTDAILLGFIEGPSHYRQAFKKSSQTIITENSDIDQSIGNRRRFYLPNANSYELSLRLILIKDPNFHTIKLAQSDLRKYLRTGPQIIFNHSFSMSGSFSRSILANRNPDDGGVVNLTNSLGIYHESLKSAASGAAQSFKGVIIYAF